MEEAEAAAEERGRTGARRYRAFIATPYGASSLEGLGSDQSLRPEMLATAFSILSMTRLPLAQLSELLPS